MATTGVRAFASGAFLFRTSTLHARLSSGHLSCSLQRSFHASSASFRTTKGQKRPVSNPRSKYIPIPKKKPRKSPQNPHAIRVALHRNVSKWCRSNATLKTLTSIGIVPSLGSALLKRFENLVERENPSLHEKSTPETDPWHVKHLEEAFERDFDVGLNKSYMNRFFDFARSLEHPGLSRYNPFDHIRNVTDMRHPAEWYPLARAIKRKIILHVGPTNSGKTYNALRALAAAPTGAYAGPLRLLAHEVWERLNDGSISAPPKNTGIDVLDAAEPPPSVVSPSHTSSGSPGRACNLLTGEEVRLVDPDAGLLSCTVEMLPFGTKFDVVVVDEIQMMADPQRGPAWTSAVLGVNARELHLCGEATVVDLVRRMAEETGDELVVNNYERLTPLEVGPSLDGDLSLIRPGDCVVAFSRSKIFGYKEKIEQETGLRCAVAYGRLPPEVRSEQASHFNNPNSGFDVMVASDAIGMGLNLKIKRVIFTTLSKWNGEEMEPLSLSQTKQIAGRAGRFGLHENGSTGQALTLHKRDTPYLEKAMASQNPTVARGFLDIPGDRLETLFNTLPSGSGLSTVFNLLEQLSLTSMNYRPASYSFQATASEFVDRETKGSIFDESITFLRTPTKWKDEKVTQILRTFIQSYMKDLSVDLASVLQNAGVFEALNEAQRLEAEHLTSLEKAKANIKSNQNTLPPEEQETARVERQGKLFDLLNQMEPTHDAIVLFLWLSYRLPLGFSNQAHAFQLKAEVEQSIDFVLSMLRSPSSQQRHALVKQLEKESPQKAFSWEYGSGNTTIQKTPGPRFVEQPHGP